MPRVRKAIHRKSDFTKGLESLMNNPALSPFNSRQAYDQMRNASALPVASLMAYVGSGKRNTKKDDEIRSKERIDKMEQD